jgi:hypothetical protein
MNQAIVAREVLGRFDGELIGQAVRRPGDVGSKGDHLAEGAGGLVVNRLGDRLPGGADEDRGAKLLGGEAG